MQAPSGPVLDAVMGSQVCPFICIGCLGTAVAEWPTGEIQIPMCAECATKLGDRVRGCKSGNELLPCSRCGRQTAGRVTRARDDTSGPS